VAAQWRIRHKLLLGLGLMGAVMAFIIGGTVRGMWAYYVTTAGIRAKHAELMAAEEFKEAVAGLTSEATLSNLLHQPSDVTDRIRKPRALLDKFDRQLRDNIEHGQNPSEFFDEQTMITGVLEALVNFEKSFTELQPFMRRSRDESSLMPENDPPRTGNVEAPAATRRSGDESAATTEGEPSRTKDPFGAIALQRATLDLRDIINKALEGHLKESRGHYQKAFWTIVPALCLGAIMLAAGIPFYFLWVSRPLRDLEAGVARVARGDFSHRIKIESGDEMQDLAEAFNDMTGRLQELYGDLARQVNERSRQLVRSERLASVGFLAAGVAHEINNPLASIAFCSEALESRLGDLVRVARAAGRGEDCEVFAKYLKMIQEEAFRCKNITERLLEFSRTGERRREESDLGALVQSVLDLARHLQNSRGKEIDLRVNTDRVPGGRILARVNSEEIKSVVLNLVVNALDSMEEGGTLTIALGQRDGMAELKFTDNGCGMTQEVLDNIFEPFFTRSRSGKGTGLGLTISHRIVTHHGGELEAESEGPTHGSTFTVRLPLQPDETPQLTPSDSNAPRSRIALETRQAA
jgi:two-component system, NtrC family, sensor kinase